mmetsp:Transcript_7511/g.10322  ORF Transcript_7511/g.10322 Transcript_7511/m.10322 type:complete len:163 (+) Transcript_7511:1-489(+)
MGTPLLPSRFLDDVPQNLLGDCDEAQSAITNANSSPKGPTAPTSSEMPAYVVQNHISSFPAANAGHDHSNAKNSKELFVKASKLLKGKSENDLSVVSSTNLINLKDAIPLEGKAAICSLTQTVSGKKENEWKLKKGKGIKQHKRNSKSKKRTSAGSVLGFRI